LNGFGKTLLIVTHDHEVASRADRILHISEGVLTSQSAAESLEVRSADSRVSEVDLST
jgi:ABC-type lipoprotein export system ATPase subunit